MDILGYSVLLASCFADVYSVHFFLAGFFKKKNNISLSKNAIAFLMASFSICGVNIIGSGLLNVITFFMITCTYVCYIYNGKLLSKLMCVVITNSAIMATELLGAIIVSAGLDNCLENVSNFPYLTLIIKFITIVILLVIRQYVGKKSKRMVSSVFWSYLLISLSSIILMLVSFFIGQNAPDDAGTRIALTLSCGFMFFSNIIVFIGFNSYSENLYKSMQKELLLSKEKANSQYYKKIAESKEERRMFIHDAKHYLSGLRGLAVSGDAEGIIDFLNNIDGKLENSEIDVFSDIPMLDAMLTEKAKIAEQNNIEFIVHIAKGVSLERVPQIEYMVMTANLIDNAIRAAADSNNNRHVIVNVFEGNNKSFLISKIENNFDHSKVHIRNGSLLSTKKDSSVHGVGLKSVEKMANESNGMFVTKIEEDKFIATLTIPMK